MPGDSGTPLVQKLGLKPGSRVAVLRGPSDFARLVAPLPEGASLTTRFTARAGLVHVSSERRAALATELERCRAAVRPDAVIWVSWPKKTSRRPTDITEDVISEVALPLGFVDVKVCAVDDVWSGLEAETRELFSRGGAPSSCRAFSAQG